MAEAYVALCLLMLPFFAWEQPMEGRTYPFVILSACMAVYAVVSGMAFPLDKITLTVGVLACWLVLSMTWTDTKQAVHELFTWLSYLFLFMVARTVPLELILWCCLLVGSCLSAVQLYRMARGMQDPATSPLFGNNNHTASYLLISLFCGLGLLKASLRAFPFVLLIGLAIGLTRCKGGILGLLAGLFIMLPDYLPVPKTGVEMVLIGTMASAVIMIVLFYLFPEGLEIQVSRYSRTSFARVLLFVSAVKMIFGKPFFGHGLNMFRVLLPEYNASLFRHRWTQMILERAGGGWNSYSHRVHNDHLEIMVEVGLVGYLLFAFLLMQIPMTPPVMGLTVGFLVAAMFFFPLREVHTAAPFVAILGAQAQSGASFGAFPSAVQAVLVLTAFVAAFLTAKKCLGLALFSYGTWSGEERFIETALRLDPHNGHYLCTLAIHYEKQGKHDLAFELAARAFYRYDGSNLKWMVCNLLARTTGKTGDRQIVQSFLDRALHLNPNYVNIMAVKDAVDGLPTEEMSLTKYRRSAT